MQISMKIRGKLLQLKDSARRALHGLFNKKKITPTTAMARSRPEFIAFIAALIITAGVLLLSQPWNKTPIDGEAAAVQSLISSDTEIFVDPFDRLVLSAKAAYVYDLKNDRVLFAKNENKPLPLASLVKVMTALVAMENIQDSAVISIDANSLRVEGDSGLFVGERWRVNDLLDFTLLVSSNDGAHALATAAGEVMRTETNSRDLLPLELFINNMNDTSRRIGMYNTDFYNVTGLDEDESKAGAYGTAKDMAALFAYIINHRGSVLEGTIHSKKDFHSLDGINHTARNTNRSLMDIPSVVASKTGYTELAEGNVVVAFDAGFGNPIIISVLGSGYDERFTDVANLTKATLEFLTREPKQLKI
ncbi:MAG: hypothetical protein A2825_02805 [Candidatus Taylorbacteria bacterium RIFCSPHIGHO2_01_FULL_43_120]|nr:MAG: hypothetical protein A2825_02805 [Candidatus Taylorbacteria bacterium RIFCSPHIGHO2_01_FULL_43_120]OHA23021.1 MAG: hypothetical protein A3B98_01950 [Candidatus Taylorbacteria bacterium RIFCSPHIGHO2_02_FULL_43_55]OHA30137.1 MAG: hypothetical protein A3E92_00985 [Candidatus Taylorbacteria bacterium RIFCSPHIGHO2_12_FULL_42_34]OHA31789.1 MAG: hypothetical protein A3B09_02490 [Candidatus Taylorbacteria bacterium RIFCSPLOWO2_01_FULL_43_83]OHA39608.1 MAG: hypothetical protein A3H58_02425 [Candi